MGICEKCIKTKPIPLCIDVVTIGKADANTMYRVWFRSLATDATYSYFILSDSDGFISIPLESGFALSTYTGYKMWVNKPNESPDYKNELLVGANIGFCFIVSAFKTQTLNYSYQPSPNIAILEVE